VDRTDGEAPQQDPASANVGGEPLSVQPARGEGPPSELRPGDCLGRYTVRRLLGAGGMGWVFEAVDPVLGRTVAIKVIQSDGEPTSKARARLLREAQALARLHHPNVVSIYDVDIEGTQVYIAMEHVQGATLGEWRLAAKRSWREVVAKFLAAGRGLAAAHAVGIIHRDFKPANVLVGEERVVVVDFGVARGDGEEPLERGPIDMLDIGVTQTGEYVGTLLYMAPEQRARGIVTAQSDQYSFCVALWEALHGERPPSTTRRAEVPGWVNAALERGLEADPQRRWQSMKDLLSALTRDPARRRWNTASFIVAVLAIALVLFATNRTGNVCAEPTTSIWNDIARASVRAAFVASGAADASDRFDHLDRAIRARVSRWANFHVEACAATEIRHQQPATVMEARMACLARGLDQIAAFVLALGSVGGARLDHAAVQVDTIGDLEACSDVVAVAQVVSPPSDWQVAAAIQRLEREAARVEALARAGDFADAKAAMPALVERARALGHQPLLARVLYDSGDLACTNADLHTAAVDLYAAANAAAAAHDDYASTEIYTRLVSCIGGIDVSLASATALAQVAEAALARVASPPELRLRLYWAEWSLRARADDPDNSLAYADLVLLFAQRLYGQESTEYALALRGLGISLYSFNAFRAAKATLNEALRLYERLLGPSHPLAIGARYYLAKTEYELGDLDAAREILERAVALTSGHETERMNDLDRKSTRLNSSHR